MVCDLLENENSSQNVNTSKTIVRIIRAVVFINTLIFEYKEYRINNELIE